MIRKTFSMPDELGEHIDQRVKTGGYGNDSEFIRELVRKDREERQGIAAIQQAIDEGMKGEGLALKPSQVRAAAKQKRLGSRRA